MDKQLYIPRTGLETPQETAIGRPIRGVGSSLALLAQHQGQNTTKSLLSMVYVVNSLEGRRRLRERKKLTTGP
jgi:hypothetical protein